MKTKLSALAMIALTSGTSAAQTPPQPDAQFCKGVDAVLGKASPDGWELGTDPVIPTEIGNISCKAIPALKKMFCTVTNLEVCADKQPSADVLAEAQRRFVYAQSRAMPSLAACLKGRTTEPYSGKTEFDGYVSVTQGIQYKQAGKPTARLYQSQSNSISADRRCQTESVVLEFLVE